jgi:hypothetical protein
MNNNNTANALSVAPQVIRHTDTYTLTVDGTDYTVTVASITGANRTDVFTSVDFTFMGGVGSITFPSVFAATGGYSRETLVTEYPIARDTLAGIIAGAIAYDNASAREWDSTH